MNNALKKMGWTAALLVFMITISGCIVQTEEVIIQFTGDERLSESQKVYINYSDGTRETSDDQSGSSISIPTDNTKWVVGAYISDGEYNWVPNYTFFGSVVQVSNIASTSTKPTIIADYAELKTVVPSEDPNYVEVIFDVYSADDILVDGRTAVFAQSEELVFKDNDGATSSYEVVTGGYASYTQDGLVTFLIKSNQLDISHIPLALYSGETLLYESFGNTLSHLSLSSGELEPAFKHDRTSYEATVPYSVSSLTVTASSHDSEAELQVNGDETVSGEPSTAIALNVGENLIPIMLTARNGTTRTYTVTVTRQDDLANADLNALSLSQGTLSPDFAAEETSYSAMVGNAVSSLTITPTVERSDATVTVRINNGAAAAVQSGQASGALALNVGVNTIVAEVTAEDGTTKAYTILVTRAAPAANWFPVYGPPSAPDKLTSTNGQLTLPKGTAGEVSLENEVLITIPADASLEELKLTVEKVTDTQELLSAGQVLLSPIYEILKNFSQNFSKPITLSFVFDIASLQSNQTVAVFYYDELMKEWVRVEGGKITGDRIEIEIDHFTKFAVFTVGTAAENPATDLNPAIGFSDIAGHWAEASIKNAASGGIVTGYPDGSFKPGAAVTRAEFAVMLVKALKLQGEGAALAFTDTARIGAWAEKAVAQAVQAGIISGYTDGSFRPDAQITRSEMAVMIAKALKLAAETGAVATFADNEAIPDWAKEEVAALQEIGVIEGTKTNTFNPQSATTRAEAAAVLLKLLQQ